MKSKEDVERDSRVDDTEVRNKEVKACSCDLANDDYLKTRRENIKIISIKISEEERRQRRKEILKALIREDNV